MIRAAASVAVVATGGTIAARSADPSSPYAVSASGEELVEMLAPECPPCPLWITSPLRRHGYMLAVDDVVAIATAARAAVNPADVSGAVVTIGTAALEEAGFLVDLLWGEEKPVILTGAMRTISQAGYDGGRNLLDAIRVALDPGSRRRGALVCLGGEAHDAREVQKLQRTSIMPLGSWPGGPTAVIDAEGVTWLRPQPSARRRFPGASPVGPVHLVKITLGDDGALVRAASGSGTRGIVIEGLPGGGGVPRRVMDELARAMGRGIPVLFTSRSPFGRGVALAAGGAGPADLVAAGAIFCRTLTAPKARLLLMCALGADLPMDELAAICAG